MISATGVLSDQQRFFVQEKPKLIIKRESCTPLWGPLTFPSLPTLPLNLRPLAGKQHLIRNRPSAWRKFKK